MHGVVATSHTNTVHNLVIHTLARQFVVICSPCSFSGKAVIKSAFSYMLIALHRTFSVSDALPRYARHNFLVNILNALQVRVVGSCDQLPA